MEYFSVITDKDLFENPIPEPAEYVLRPTVKGIIFDNDGKVALVHIHNRSLFPGGGVEEGETHEEALVRECMEEIGCAVNIERSLGVAVQLRNKGPKRYEIEYFVGHVVGEKGAPTSSQADEQGIEIKWTSPEEVLTVLETQIPNLAKDVYMPYFNCRTSLDAWNLYLTYSSKK